MKMKASVLNWVIIVLLLLSATLLILIDAVTTSTCLEENKTDAYQNELYVYSDYIKIKEANEDNFLDAIYRGENISKVIIPNTRLQNHKIQVNAFLEKSKLFIELYSEENTLKGTGLIYIFKDLFYGKNPVYDNKSDNDIQGEKQQIIEKVFNTPKPRISDRVVFVELEGGKEYDIIISNNKWRISAEGTTTRIFDREPVVCLIGTQPETNVNISFSEFNNSLSGVILVNGDVSFSNPVEYDGIIVIKNGNLYADRLNLHGKILVDGLSNIHHLIYESNRGIRYGLIFENFLEYSTHSFYR
ncbi:MAG: hypothetical protein Q4Q17_05655 [Tissierellia bacterium]|nr:hypothetical protein [Tissierellia bacterium]